MQKFLRCALGMFLFAALVCCFTFSYLLLHAPAFENGEAYTFYAEKNSSSKAYVTNTPALSKIFLGPVAGESVLYQGNRVEELAKRYKAKLLLFEEACGVKNFYFHSPMFKDSVEICGVQVNLHIALTEKHTAAGTPLIFGGF